jgi:hypothetical protein
MVARGRGVVTDEVRSTLAMMGQRKVGDGLAEWSNEMAREFSEECHGV